MKLFIGFLISIGILLSLTSVSLACPGSCQPTSYDCGGYYEAGLCPGPSDVECCVESTPSCSGQCQWTGLGCDGNFESGLCPGPSDVECCVSGGGGGSGCDGVCQPTSYSCSSGYVPGLCPGDSSIECCPESTPACDGQCQLNSLPCDGSYLVGDCPGDSDIQCCSSSGGGGGGGGGSCAGVCQPTSDYCSSGYIAGLCPGDSSIECCPQPTPSCDGQCQLNSLPCGGSYLVGDCPGDSDIQCCTGGGGGGGGGVQGVDLSTLTSQGSFSCLLSNGYTFVIPRGYMSVGSPDPNCPQTVRNARAAGISNIGVYMFPCPTCSASPQSQVQQAVSYYQDNGVSYNVFWLDIEGTQYWSSSLSYNQDFFNGLISELQALGQTIGVYTSASQWNPIFGSGFTAGSPYPLWYAHYDDNPSFSDFSPFGGWSKPTLKQYLGDQSICGAGVDVNWGPAAPG